MTMIDVLPYIYWISCLGVIGFQVALIAGAPWGHITQGGQHDGALPAKNRILAGVSVFLIAGKALAIGSAGGFWPLWPDWTAWAALALQAVVTLLNWITPSNPERRLWAPIATFMLVIAALVVLTAPG